MNAKTVVGQPSAPMGRKEVNAKTVAGPAFALTERSNQSAGSATVHPFASTKRTKASARIAETCKRHARACCSLQRQPRPHPQPQPQPQLLEHPMAPSALPVQLPWGRAACRMRCAARASARSGPGRVRACNPPPGSL